jgi:CBS-domain-containing membrane protein
MKVKEAMHKGVDWVDPDTPVIDLAKLMRQHDIGAIPIGQNDRLIGMVTDRDIVCKGSAEGWSASSVWATLAARRRVICCLKYSRAFQPITAETSIARLHRRGGVAGWRIPATLLGPQR